MRMLFVLCFVIFGAAALSSNVWAADFYVSPAGADSSTNDGSSSHPWKTINYADSRLPSTPPAGGIVVHVLPGTYYGSISTKKSGSASARIVFISETKWAAKILNSNWTAAGSYVDINGFDMTSPGGLALSIYQATSVHVLNNNMHDFTTGGCGPYGVISELNNPTSNNLISGNIIRHAGNYNADSNHCVHLHGIYSEGKNTVIENNIISGITGFGIKRNMAPGACGPGVISNNMVFNNGGGIDLTEYSDAGFVCAWDYNTMNNNIIVNNGIDGGFGGRFGINYYHVSGTHNLVTNNIVYGNKPSDYAHHDVSCAGGTPISGSDADGTAGGCPSTNPIFGSDSTVFANYRSDTNTSPDPSYNAANYKSKIPSPAIDNGRSLCASGGLSPCVPNTDFTGDRRPQGITYDVGPFESQSTITASPTATASPAVGGATPTPSPTPLSSGSGCVTSGLVFQSKPFASQTGSFAVEFDATPTSATIDSDMGLSNGSATGYSALATTVEFHNNGLILARNGGIYTAQSSIPYVGGKTYHFKMIVNVPAHVYSAYVTPMGGVMQTIGSNFAFRTEQAAISSLNALSFATDIGSETLCNMSLTSSTFTTVKIGETNVFSTIDSGNANLLLAQKTSLTQSATIQTLSFYVGTPSGSLTLGIYDASGAGGGPGTLKATTNTFTAVAGWNIQYVKMPVLLPVGTYWLAYLPSSNALSFRVDHSSGSFVARPQTFGSLPNSFGTPTIGAAAHWSFYGTLVP